MLPLRNIGRLDFLISLAHLQVSMLKAKGHFQEHIIVTLNLWEAIMAAVEMKKSTLMLHELQWSMVAVQLFNLPRILFATSLEHDES